MVTVLERFESPDLTPLNFVRVVGWRRSLQKRGGYSKLIARLDFGCCCQHKIT